MKTYKNLYKEICNKDYIRKTLIEATADKKYASWFNKHADSIVESLFCMLKNKDFKLHEVRVKIKHDRKKDRKITIQDFMPNKAFDYLLTSKLKDIVTNSMFYWSTGNVLNKGLDMCLNYNIKAVKKYKYCLQLDIKKYYENIDKEILYNKIKRKIRDKDFLDFYKAIISDKGKEIYLGSPSSQYLANYYLQDFDYYIKQTLKIKEYNRYVDNL